MNNTVIVMNSIVIIQVLVFKKCFFKLPFSVMVSK